MANLVSVATGNFTTNTTWGSCTSISDSETASHAIGTSPTTFGNFVPGAVTIDRYAIKMSTRAASPSGTFQAILRNVTLGSDAITVTVNVSDLPTPGTIQGSVGWVCFKLAAPVLLVAGNQYAFKLVCSSSGSQVTVYSANATPANGALSYLLVTTTNAAPAAGDSLHMCGAYTGAGASTTYTITMDSTAATAYGSGTAQNASTFTINGKAILQYGTSAATNYILRVATTLRIYSGGTLNIGTSGGEIPRDSTAVLEFPCTGDGDYGYYFDDGSTVNMYGLSRTSGKNIDRCYLNTDEAAAQTVLGVDTDTGWLSGDMIQIAATARTITQGETRTLSADATATTLTVTAGLTNAHSGTSPTQAEVVLLTRNVKIRSTSATAMSYGRIRPTAVISMSWAEFRYMSSILSAKTAPLYLETTTGSVTCDRCSFYDLENLAINTTGSACNNFAITNCVGANLGGFASIGLTSGSVWSLVNNWYIGGPAGTGTGFVLADVGGTVTGNVCVGVATAFAISDAYASGTTYGTISDNTAHTCTTGFSHTNTQEGLVIANSNIWRINGNGITFVGPALALRYETATIFGCATSSINVGTNGLLIGAIFSDITSGGDTTFPSPTGIVLSGHCIDTTVQNSTFSVVSGIKVAHTQDIQVGATNPNLIAQLYITNTTLAAATEILNPSNLNTQGWIRIQKKDATTTNHSTVLKYGVLALDASVFNTAAPSLKMTPTNASAKLESATKYWGVKAAVNSGSTITASVYVNKNASYNGAQPRLIVRKNVAAGISADTVLDTMTVGTGSWEQLSGTTAAVTDNAVLEFIVDCDGTAGYISVDDWQMS